MTPETILSVDGLSVCYDTSEGPKSALRNVSFAVRRGETLALVGESGSGKSTVTLSLLGLLASNAQVSAKGIMFEGEDLFLAPESRRAALRGSRIGTVFQDPFTSLNPALPVGFQIAEPLIEHLKYPRQRALDRAVELLAEVGISDPARVGQAYPHQLSGGMQQRALIASALACEPTLLLLDEPTTALDVTVEAQILALLRKLKEARALSIVFVTHNLGLVRRFCDSVCVLYAGEVLEEGPVDDVLGAPHHPYTKGLVASSPRILAERDQRLQSIPGKIPEWPDQLVGCIFRERCPFVEAGCEQPQSIEPVRESRTVRCWRSTQLADVAWPSAGLGKRAAVARASSRLLDVRDLRKTFHVKSGLRAGGNRRSWMASLFSPSMTAVNAVDGITLSVAPGEVVGIVGESGSGKSTLGRTILRLLEPSGGTIAVGGEDITRRPQRSLRDIRKSLQIVLQNPDSSLNPRKTIEQTIGRSLTLLHGLRGCDCRQRVEELLEMVGLPASYRTRYPHQLSGGEKQRVGIARALAPSPALIVCDEAVSALDVSLQASVLNLLLDMRDQLNLAYLFISHDLSVVAYLADRIAVMRNGRIVELGSRDQVLRPPYHPYTRALLSAVPSLSERAIEFEAPESAEGMVGAGRGPDSADPLVEVAPGHWIAGGCMAQPAAASLVVVG